MERRWPNQPGGPEDRGDCVFEVPGTLGDAFVALDAQWRVRFASAGLSGERFWDLLPQDADPRALETWTCYRRCMQERAPVTFLEHVPATGVWTEVRALPTRDGGLEVYFRDVTAWRRAMARSEERRQLSEAQSELEQQLIGIVSHDLRNPLQAIRLSAVLGLRFADMQTREQRSFGRILSASDRAIRMINDLLDFTRVRARGGMGVQPKPTDLHGLAAQVVEELLSTWPQRRVEIRASGDGRGLWDPDRLSQVVQNLVGNALEHTTEDVSVTVTTRGEEDCVILEVHNGGPPISAEDLPRLLEPFQRGQQAHGGRGLGLGLYITSHIVQAHGGTLGVQSSSEAGTTFTVRLPRREGPELARGAER